MVEADLGAGRRAILHGRVAVALEAASSGCDDAHCPVEALAYHYGRSDAPDKALVYLEAAGDRARAQAALAAAADYYRELAERLHALGRVHDEARIQEKLGAVLYTRAMRRPLRHASGRPSCTAQRAISKGRGALRRSWALSTSIVG